MHPRATASGLTIFVLLPIVLLSSCAGESPPHSEAESPAPAPATATRSIESPTIDVVLTHGIDVSGHSGVVDWKAVESSGATFAFVKATEGVDLADPGFAANWSSLAELGIVRGAYHFYVTEDEPREQAEFFISNVRLDSGDFAPVVDIELIGANTAPGLAGRLRTYLEAVEAHYGIRPILYTSPKFWNEHLDETFGEYPLWIAEYGVDQPTVPNGWTDWDLWQYRGDAEVNGVEKTADLSRANPDRDDLGRLLVP